MIKRQLWSSGHHIDKPDKWVEDSSFEAERPEHRETRCTYECEPNEKEQI